MTTTTSCINQIPERLDRGDDRQMRLHLDRASTGGVLSVLTCELGPASAGPPLHQHPGTDETFVVLEGTLLLHLDGRTHRLPTGGAAFVPRGSVHTFATGPGSAARFLAVHTPGGFEQMHRDVRAAEAAAGRVLGALDIIPIAQQHDWVLAGPPLLPTGELAAPAGPAR